MRPPDRFNRIALALLGLALVAAGAYGLVRGAGWLGTSAADDPIVGAGLDADLGANATWLRVAGIVFALAVAYLGARWLAALLSPPPALSRLTVRAAGGEGRTRISADAVADALAADVENDPEVVAARARVVDDGPLEVELDVDAVARTDLTALRRRLHEQAIEHLRQALETDVAVATVHLRLGGDRPRTR